MSVNKVILLGRLTRDVELKFLPSGNAVANFSVATSESYKDKEGNKQEKTEFTNIVMFGKVAELANQYLSKGRQVYLEGKLQTRSWDDKDGNKRYTTEVVADKMSFVGNSSQEKQEGKKEEYTPAEKSSFATDDIPF